MQTEELDTNNKTNIILSGFEHRLDYFSAIIVSDKCSSLRNQKLHVGPI